MSIDPRLFYPPDGDAETSPATPDTTLDSIFSEEPKVETVVKPLDAREPEVQDPEAIATDEEKAQFETNENGTFKLDEKQARIPKQVVDAGEVGTLKTKLTETETKLVDVEAQIVRDAPAVVIGDMTIDMMENAPFEYGENVVNYDPTKSEAEQPPMRYRYMDLTQVKPEAFVDLDYAKKTLQLTEEEIKSLIRTPDKVIEALAVKTDPTKLATIASKYKLPDGTNQPPKEGDDLKGLPAKVRAELEEVRAAKALQAANAELNANITRDIGKLAKVAGREFTEKEISDIGNAAAAIIAFKNDKGEVYDEKKHGKLDEKIFHQDVVLDPKNPYLVLELAARRINLLPAGQPAKQKEQKATVQPPAKRETGGNHNVVHKETPEERLERIKW
jgi:hypothetical protein